MTKLPPLSPWATFARVLEVTVAALGGPVEREGSRDLVGGIGRQRGQQAAPRPADNSIGFLHDNSSLISLCFRR
jgi:hypothetical protein